VFLTLGGLIMGLLLGHGLHAAAAPLLRERTGLLIEPWSLDHAEITALLVIAAAGLLSGLVPALSSYRRTPAHDLGITE
jgi:putative ABC transport system permease protein